MQKPLKAALIILSIYIWLWMQAAYAETQLLWGDTHVHTSYSFDSYMLGNVTIDPDAAYRYAKGLPVAHPETGATLKIDQPLDFLVVSDHAKLLGIAKAIGANDQRLSDSPRTKKLTELLNEKQFSEAFKLIFSIFTSSDPEVRAELIKPNIQKSSWSEIVDAADKHYMPGKFTAIVGWEWTSMPNGNNLHRVIFTASGGMVAKSFSPFSSLDSDRPEDLWSWLEKTGKSTGADFVAIPHNSNLSGGLMFNTVDSNGKPIDKSYAQIRARWEPVVEITQSKGDSETHGKLSPNDEFANFEFFPSLLGVPPKAPSITEADYVRPALKRGLEFDFQVGANPYKFGVIGSTDNHIGLSSSSENGFLGKTVADATPAQRSNFVGETSATGWDISASGRAAVWAESNTRESIMAAFKRREVYGTTGPRIALRFFGGFDFKKQDANARDIAKIGYKKGVPMGSDLTAAPKGKTPSFLIHAIKDPREGNLDRVQLVKGWLDVSGDSHEKVYDVAWAGERKADAKGKLAIVGNTVDVKTGFYSNHIGAAQLATVWKDPDFDPNQRAFYYVRVLQIPTPRYSLDDALALQIPVEETGHPAAIQERAYSSSIWYLP